MTIAPARPGAVTQGGHAAADAETQVLTAFVPARRTPAARVVALIPARNESASIGATIGGLRAQTQPPDMIVVVANNCTDGGATAAAALAAGAEVLDMGANPDRKAGALNYGIEMILSCLADRDRVFVMDGDTVLVPRFFEIAGAVMDADPLAVVAGRYACKAEHGLIGMMQRNEFARDGRRIDRRQGRTHILVGTSTLLPVALIRQVINARRAGRLPAGYAYVPDSLTEDYELTLAIKTLGGWHTLSPAGCDAVTDVMPTLPLLWHQRIRWWKGGTEDLMRYGWTRVTRPYIWRQSVMGLCLAAFALYLGTLAATYATGGAVHWVTPWLALTVLFAVNRVVEVRKAGPLAMLVSGLLVFELAYDLWSEAVYLTALVKAIRGQHTEWAET